MKIHTHIHAMKEKYWIINIYLKNWECHSLPDSLVVKKPFADAEAMNLTAGPERFHMPHNKRSHHNEKPPHHS